MKSDLPEELNAVQLRAYESFDAMDAWGLLRRLAEPLSAAEVAERLGIELQAAQAALDLAEAARLVRKLRAGGGRHGITYASETEELEVVLPGGPAAEVRARIDSWMMAAARHQESILQRMVPVNKRNPEGDRFFTYATEFKATKSDIEELFRKMIQLNRFMDEILDRMDKPLPEGEELCEAHAYFMRIAPIRGALKDAPLVKIHSQDARQIVRAGRQAAPRSLGRREREIAAMLQRGLSRGETAKRLGISVETVSSHCKNLFRKLGINRATELSRFSFETKPEGAPPKPEGAPPKPKGAPPKPKGAPPTSRASASREGA